MSNDEPEGNKEQLAKELAVLTVSKSEFQVIVGRRLFELRKSLNQSQENIAAELGLTQNIIQRAESGAGAVDNLLLIINYYLKLGYNLNYLLGWNSNIFEKKLETKDYKDDIDMYFESSD